MKVSFAKLNLDELSYVFQGFFCIIYSINQSFSPIKKLIWWDIIKWWKVLKTYDSILIIKDSIYTLHLDITFIYTLKLIYHNQKWNRCLNYDK